jgi:hypothetical protein
MTAGFLLLVSGLSKGIQRKRRINGKIHGGDKLLIDLRNDNTGLVGNYDRFKKKKKSQVKISRI